MERSRDDANPGCGRAPGASLRPMCHATRWRVCFPGSPPVAHGSEVPVAQGGAPVGDRQVGVNVIERPLTRRSLTTW